MLIPSLTIPFHPQPLPLALHLPHTHTHTPLPTQVTCSILYVVAMQSWWRPQCGQYGPNNMLYASILVNCFLLYAIIRFVQATSCVTVY